MPGRLYDFGFCLFVLAIFWTITPPDASAQSKVSEVQIPVFYITNRHDVEVGNKQEFDQKRRYHNVCHYGIEHVAALLPGHSTAIDDNAKALGWTPSTLPLAKPSGVDPVTKALSNESITDKELFFSKLKAAVDASPNKDLLVFVHGYNTSFEGAAETGANFAYSFQSPVLVFSWPSQHDAAKYTFDECNAEWSLPDFRILLRDLDEQIGPQNIALVGHSMGNRLLMWSLVSRADRAENRPQQYKAIVMSSPDIDSGTFRIWSSLVRTNSPSNWVFISHKDIPLRLSGGVHGYQRAGGISGVPGIDLFWRYPEAPYGFTSVDFTNVDSETGHSLSFPNISSVIRKSAPALGFTWLTKIERNGSWMELSKQR